MNNYRNYGNYGNRRVLSGMDDCGCNKNNSARMMQDRMHGKQEKDCGCVKAEKEHETDCGCATESMYHDMKNNDACCEEDMPGKALAMAYVPWQTWRKLYDVCEGFSNGTIFEELNLEFYGRRCN